MKYLTWTLACLVIGCGGNQEMPPDLPPSTYSCDQTQAASPTCKEFTNISATQTVEGLQSLCGVPLNPKPCPRENNLGGCRATNANYTLTTWFYPGSMFMTMGEVQTYCASAFVAPN